MRQINDHLKSIMEIPNKQQKSSPNPKNWNWVAIIAWAIIGTIAFSIFKFLFNLI